MRFEVTPSGGRVCACTKEEKKCKVCKTDNKPLFFNEDAKCLLCLKHQDYFQRSVECQNFVIDKWVITDAN